MSEERNKLKQNGKPKKISSNKSRIKRTKLKIKFEDEDANRKGDLGKVAEMRYGKIPEATKALKI